LGGGKEKTPAAGFRGQKKRLKKTKCKIKKIKNSLKKKKPKKSTKKNWKKKKKHLLNPKKKSLAKTKKNSLARAPPTSTENSGIVQRVLMWGGLGRRNTGSLQNFGGPTKLLAQAPSAPNAPRLMGFVNKRLRCLQRGPPPAKTKNA